MRVPIITYHGIGESGPPLWTPIPAFEAHLDAFAACGFRTIALSDLVNALRDGLPPPENALVITFDDGYESVSRDAWPRLKARNFTATVFLVTDHCGGTNQWPGQKAAAPLSPLVSWNDVEAMAAQGCEFGAHTRTHACLPVLGRAAIEDEVAGSQDAIRQHTGQAVQVFAYPYGAVNAQTADVVRRYFGGAATTRLGLVRASCDPYVLPRVDAWYLRSGHIPYLRGGMYRTYLSARDALRTVRRRFQSDWEPKGPERGRPSA